MEWTRSESLSLAAERCVLCHGLGLKSGRRGASTPCRCVLRSIFRACYNRFRICVNKEKHLSRVTLDAAPRGGRRITWGRKDEEYIADFLLVTRRSLSAAEYKLFKYHFLLGADWKLCVRRLNIDRGTFFHDLYKIEEKLGRIYRELKPYALYPLDEYFNGRTVNDTPTFAEREKVVPLRRNSLNRILHVPSREAA